MILDTVPKDRLKESRIFKIHTKILFTAEHFVGAVRTVI
jgi:hypothetical protein